MPRVRRLLVPLCLLLASVPGAAQDLDSLIFEPSFRAACVENTFLTLDFVKWEAEASARLMRSGKELDRALASIQRQVDRYRAAGGCSSLPAEELQAHKERMRLARRMGDSATVRGLGGIEWGDDPTKALALFGVPSKDTTDPELRYREILYVQQELLGRKAAVRLRFDATWGFAEGIYFFDVGATESCERLYDNLKETLTARYSSIKPSIDRKVNASSSLSLCDAASIGKGAAESYWSDAARGGGSITLRLSPGGKGVGVIASNGDGRKIEKRIEFRQARRAF